MYFNDVFNDFIKDEIIFRGLSSSTLEGYKYFKRLFNRYVGNIKLEQITMQTVRDFRGELMSYQKQDTTRNYVGNLRVFLRYCVNNGYKVGVNVSLIRQPKRTKRQLSIPTELELRQFIKLAVKPCRGYSRVNRLRNKAMLLVLYSSGIRVGELCKLNRDSIVDRQFVVVGKSKEPRLCFITAETQRAINDYLAVRKDDNLALFVQNNNGLRVTPPTVRNVFQNACRRSGGQFNGIHPHTFRHCFATRLIARRVDIGNVGVLLGHTSLDTTRVYIHYTNPQLRAVYDSASV